MLSYKALLLKDVIHIGNFKVEVTLPHTSVVVLVEVQILL